MFAERKEIGGVSRLAKARVCVWVGLNQSSHPSQVTAILRFLGLADRGFKCEGYINNNPAVARAILIIALVSQICKGGVFETLATL
jgi:hypothetical protein